MIRRRLFTLASAVSLLLVIPAVVFWMRSHRTQDYAIKGLAGPDTVFVNSGVDWLTLNSAGSALRYKGGWTVNSIPYSAATAYRLSVGIPPARGGGRPALTPAVRIPGFCIFNVTGVMILPERPYSPRSYQTLRIVSIHYAWLTGITAVLPTAWLVAWGRRFVRRGRPGHCRECSYNLAGNTSGVCPECGKAVEGKAGT